MKKNIEEVRILSAKIRRLLEAKQEVGVLIYVKLHGDIFVTEPLKEALARLEGKILSKRLEIKELIESIPGFDKSKHVSIDYISIPDLKSKKIDISINGDGSSVLFLETGEIIDT